MWVDDRAITTTVQSSNSPDKSTLVKPAGCGLTKNKPSTCIQGLFFFIFFKY